MEPLTTTLEWHKPEDKMPPFRRPILMALGGHNELFISGVITTESPNDDEPEDDDFVGSYDLLMKDGKWIDYQFFIEFEKGDEQEDWYSDLIAYWTELPGIPQRKW